MPQHGRAALGPAVLALGLLLALLPGRLAAQTLRFGAYPATVSGTYSPDGGVILTQTITIRDRNEPRARTS